MLKFIQRSDYFICYVIFVMKKYKLHKWMQLITGIDISSILYLFFIFTFQFYPWNKLYLFIDITEKKKSVIWWLVLKHHAFLRVLKCELLFTTNTPWHYND